MKVFPQTSLALASMSALLLLLAIYPCGFVGAQRLHQYKDHCPTSSRLISPSNTFPICSGEGATFTATPNDAVAYHWQNGQTTRTITVQDSGWIWVDIQFPKCRHRDSTYLAVQPCACIYLPNAISANCGGQTIQPEIRCELEAFEWTVYDRWGRQVYQSNNPNAAWNTQVDGNHVPEGVYVYVIKYQAKGDLPQRQTGSVTVVR